MQSSRAVLDNKKIVFIGGGNIAQALIHGLLAQGFTASNITVSDPHIRDKKELINKGIVAVMPESESVKQAIQSADVVLLAVKPQVMAQVVADFSDSLTTQLIISVAAGLSTQTLSNMLQGYQNIVRTMPNTPAMIQQGAAGLYASDLISEVDRSLAEAIIAASSLVSWVEDEAQLHAVTAVSGSAPAYFFYMFESMIDAGVELGLTQQQATDLAIQTALGSAQMALNSEEKPAELRRKVTSPNGTTHEAIESLKHDNFKHIIKQAMLACYHRSEEISEQMKK